MDKITQKLDELEITEAGGYLLPKEVNALIKIARAAQNLMNDEDGDLDAFSYGIIPALRDALNELGEL